ncbi:MAG: hypothetical protein AB8H12_16285 [Lewinella sp.]
MNTISSHQQQQSDHLVNMKLSISLFLASLAISSSAYLGWRIWQPNLTGHWDIIETGLNEDYSAYDWIESLDITSDDIVFLNYDPQNLYPVVGEVSRLFRSIRVGPTCLSLKMKFHPNGNTLHLELPNYETPSRPYRLTAVRNFKCPHPWKPEY